MVVAAAAVAVVAVTTAMRSKRGCPVSTASLCTWNIKAMRKSEMTATQESFDSLTARLERVAVDTRVLTRLNFSFYPPLYSEYNPSKAEIWTSKTLHFRQCLSGACRTPEVETKEPFQGFFLWSYTLDFRTSHHPQNSPNSTAVVFSAAKGAVERGKQPQLVVEAEAILPVRRCLQKRSRQNYRVQDSRSRVLCQPTSYRALYDLG